MPDPFAPGSTYADALPALPTPRLLLRPLTEDDDAALVHLFSDERSLETWGTPGFASLDDARAYRAALEEGFGRRVLFIWGVFEQETGTLVGVGILTRWAQNHRRVDMGYYLSSPYWGRGYATEAAGALLRFAFGTLGVHRIEAEVVPGNTGSERVLGRLGFTHEALLKERLWGFDGPEDSNLFRLLEPDFSPQERQA
ncbi:MAG TPA: GNAT family N-acetyltransferase [Rhodothermales bacterium]|nr:GNAT family N-acetyltransferase [Rhodothermales bacterium]